MRELQIVVDPPRIELRLSLGAPDAARARELEHPNWTFASPIDTVCSIASLCRAVIARDCRLGHDAIVPDHSQIPMYGNRARSLSLACCLAVAVVTATALDACSTSTEPKSGFGSGHPSGKMITNVPDSGKPDGARVSPGNILYVTELNTNRLGKYDFATQRLLSTSVPTGLVPTDLVFTADGSKAYVTNQGSGTIGVIDVASNTQISTIPCACTPLRVALSPDGETLYATSGIVAAISTSTLAVDTILPAGLWEFNGLALNPVSSLMYVTTDNGLIFEIDRATGQAIGEISSTNTYQDLVVSGDGRYLFIANESGPLEVRVAYSGGFSDTLPAADSAFGLALTKDGTQLYITRPRLHDVLVLNTADYSVTRLITGGAPRRIAFDTTGKVAAITNDSGYVTFVK